MPSVKLFHWQTGILYFIYRYSFMMHPKMFALCQNPSTTWAIVYVIRWFHLCQVQIYVWMRYLICCVFSYICSVSWSIYEISILLCSMSETICVVSKNPFACFNSFITWAKIALFVYKHKYQNSPKYQLEIVFEVRLCHRFSPIDKNKDKHYDNKLNTSKISWAAAIYWDLSP